MLGALTEERPVELMVPLPLMPIELSMARPAALSEARPVELMMPLPSMPTELSMARPPEPI
jgi:hypothetical protein